MLFANMEVTPGGNCRSPNGSLYWRGSPRTPTRELLASVVSVLPRRASCSAVGGRDTGESARSARAAARISGVGARRRLWSAGRASLQGRIEESSGQRLELLPRDTQKLLLIAAAEPIGDLALLRRAAQELGIPEAAAGAAETEGLLRLDGAVAASADPPCARRRIGLADLNERCEVHRALAEQATDPQQIDPIEAGVAPRCAQRRRCRMPRRLRRNSNRPRASAQARGGYAAAAAFLEPPESQRLTQLRRSDRARRRTQR